MRPHTFVVKRNNGVDQVPIVDDWVEVVSGNCNTQVGSSGGIGNENEAMDYDYVLFYDFSLDENGDRITDTEIKVEDQVTSIIYGKEIIGTVKKLLPGQITNRIWFNEISK
jgi:hypothetical protein